MLQSMRLQRVRHDLGTEEEKTHSKVFSHASQAAEEDIGQERTGNHSLVRWSPSNHLTWLSVSLPIYQVGIMTHTSAGGCQL